MSDFDSFLVQLPTLCGFVHIWAVGTQAVATQPPLRLTVRTWVPGLLLGG